VQQVFLLEKNKQKNNVKKEGKKIVKKLAFLSMNIE
jgi:hypothetical protein